jgi:hypothetical protein
MALRCRSVIARLPDAEEGRASWLVRAGVRLHLAICGDCSRYLRQLEAVRAALGALAGRGVAAGTKAELTARFRAWRAGERDA